MAANWVWALVLLGALLVSAQTTPREDIDNTLPRIYIHQLNKADPTRFEISCSTGDRLPNGGTVISLGISLLPDKQPLDFSPLGMTSELPPWRHIAYFDKFSSNTNPIMNPNLKEKGVTVKAYSYNLYFTGGTCEDTGLYRCKAAYLPAHETSFKVKVSEARLPACLPGALATADPRPLSVNGQRRSSFLCQVNASLVEELVSLEVSVIRNGSRQVLAYINSFFNDAKVIYSSEDVLAEGYIYPLNPERSNLTVTQWLDLSEEISQHITSCKAVYSGRNVSDNPVVSWADGKIWFRK